jgi:hypothetical protein
MFCLQTSVADPESWIRVIGPDPEFQINADPDPDLDF